MIKTSRLILKDYEDEDQDSMVALLTNEEIKKTFMIPDFQTRNEAIAMFKKYQGFSKSDSHYELGIYRSHELIGFINDVFVDGASIELGYVIHPDFHNNGYATEALAAAISDLFRRGYCEIIAGAFEENAASCRVMEKCKMTRIDREEMIRYHDQLHHCIYYSIKKAE